MAVAESIDLSRLTRSLNDVTNSVARVEAAVNDTNQRLNNMGQSLTVVSSELQKLKSSFEKFMEESKRADALQKAATELVRVRQELEQNYGGYKVVRETMLGVLQATDLALVKKTTISKVTEELMLSTPDYWLAPCLIAVSAWIGNDRSLAERAIAEALRRDEEKTALTMALICRRNDRVDTCYEWLSLYFAKQSAMNFTESNFTYLNAYLNGVFGPDTKHMCDDYVARWMRELQENGEDFEAKQVAMWRAYCSNFTVDLEGQFPQLKNCAREYNDIAEYVGRINSVDRIANNFSGMKNTKVDQQLLKKNIDQTLVTLVSRYDTKEEPLRREERYLMAVRYFDGDITAARQSILEADRKKTEETIDLIGQMTNVAMKKREATPSEKKTAVTFLSSYIRGGFENYITEKRNTFPKAVTLQIDGWQGQIGGNVSGEMLKGGFEQNLEGRRAQELQAAQASNPQTWTIAAAVLAVCGLIGLFVAWPVGLILLAVAAVCLFQYQSKKKEIVTQINNINENYNARIVNGKMQIDAAIMEWQKAQAMVRQFESQKLRDVVA